MMKATIYEVSTTPNLDGGQELGAARCQLIPNACLSFGLPIQT